jgi:hypothetical protein
VTTPAPEAHVRARKARAKVKRTATEMAGYGNSYNRRPIMPSEVPPDSTFVNQILRLDGGSPDGTQDDRLPTKPMTPHCIKEYDQESQHTSTRKDLAAPKHGFRPTPFLRKDIKKSYYQKSESPGPDAPSVLTVERRALA